MFYLLNWCDAINCATLLPCFNVVNSRVWEIWLLVQFCFKEKTNPLSALSPITGKWWTTCNRWKYVRLMARLLTSVSPGSVRAIWWRGGSIPSKAGTRWVQNFSQVSIVFVLIFVKDIHKLGTKDELLYLPQSWKCVHEVLVFLNLHLTFLFSGTSCWLKEFSSTQRRSKM